MKNLLAFLIFALVCETAFSDVGLSKTFKFDGSEIKQDEPLTLHENDPITYSTALAKGDPLSLEVNVANQIKLDQNATLFWDESGTEVEGKFFWEYDSYQYADFSVEDPYTLKQIIKTDTETKVLTRTIMITPEPIVAFLVIAAGLITFYRKQI